MGIILLFVQGLMKIIRESKDFYELERGIHELTQKVSRQLLELAAEEMDKKLMEDRDKRVWEVVEFRAEQKEKRKLHGRRHRRMVKSFIADTGRPICEQVMDKIRFKGY